METLRQSKVARLIQRELGEMFLVMTRDHFNGTMITVTTVRVSPDLSVAKVYLSIFGTAEKQSILSKVSGYSREIRFQLGNRIKHQVRIIPELHFIIDDSLDYIDRIDQLLHN